MLDIYPLVNIQKATEIHFFNGNIHSMAIFCSYDANYERVLVDEVVL